MFTRPAQHLTIHSPSTTTVSYTVSNAPFRVTRSSTVLSYFQVSLRVLVCICVVLIDIATAEAIFASKSWTTVIPFGSIENAARHIAELLDWRVTAVASFLVIYFCMRRSYTGKVLLIVIHV